MSNYPPTRYQVLQLYKNLLYMGKEYPLGYTYFRDKAHGAFSKNKDVTDPDKIKNLIGFGEYIIEELKALYFLKKYRAMKNRYYNQDSPSSPTKLSPT